MKKSAKIALLILCLGWIPLFIFDAIGYDQTSIIHKIVMGVGLICCLGAAFVLNVTLSNPAMWKTADELDNAKAEAKRQYKALLKAEDRLISAALKHESQLLKNKLTDEELSKMYPHDTNGDVNVNAWLAGAIYFRNLKY